MVKSKDMSVVLITRFIFGVAYTVPLIEIKLMLGVMTAMTFSLAVSSRQVVEPVFNISNFNYQGQSAILFCHDASQLKVFQGAPISWKRGDYVSPPR